MRRFDIRHVKFDLSTNEVEMCSSSGSPKIFLISVPMNRLGLYFR
jgi:hypothetical protein